MSSLMRLVTTGSVDDGKSTLIGRLLFETKSILEDQYEAIKKTSHKRGHDEVDLSLLLDGLAAEREQLITIDVAYRYFSTKNRNFIIADTPGHEQYTRNMVTGASTADLAIILIDARKGVLTQSRRHCFLASLLRVPHLIVAVNKMDLVDYEKAPFDAIVQEFSVFTEKLDIHDVTYIPVSALKGDNLVERSDNMPWYDGPTLLSQLENVYIAADHNLIDFRFPVQYVIRPHLDYRGFAGRVVSGTIRRGEGIMVLPSGKTSVIKAIETNNGQLEEAIAGQSIALRLEDEIDVSRGDMFVRKQNLPMIGTQIEAMICWMSETPMRQGAQYIVKHTTRSVNAFISKVIYRIDVNTLHRESVDIFQLNEIGRVEIRTAIPLFYDPYRNNRGTGAFIIIDPLSNDTVAAGMIRGAKNTFEDLIQETGAGPIQSKVSPHTIWDGGNISRAMRERQNNHRAVVLWLTGYSGSGKSTIAKALEKRLYDSGCHTILLDGDNLRHGLCGDLGFSEKDRTENIRRVAELAKLLFENGSIIIATFISPLQTQRHFARSLIPQGSFFEIYVRCSLDVCKRRDPKGLYKKALAREIPEFTGVSAPYEEPENPELIIDSDLLSVEQIVEQIFSAAISDPSRKGPL
jgi:bifunctional enzyme CysN/CysC